MLTTASEKLLDALKCSRNKMASRLLDPFFPPSLEKKHREGTLNPNLGPLNQL